MDKRTCSNCGKLFGYELIGVNAPGCREREDLICPYCGAICHSEMTALTFVAYKLDNQNNQDQ